MAEGGGLPSQVSAIGFRVRGRRGGVSSIGGRWTAFPPSSWTALRTTKTWSKRNEDVVAETASRTRVVWQGSGPCDAEVITVAARASSKARAALPSWTTSARGAVAGIRAMKLRFLCWRKWRKRACMGQTRGNRQPRQQLM